MFNVAFSFCDGYFVVNDNIVVDSDYRNKQAKYGVRLRMIITINASFPVLTLVRNKEIDTLTMNSDKNAENNYVYIVEKYFLNIVDAHNWAFNDAEFSTKAFSSLTSYKHHATVSANCAQPCTDVYCNIKFPIFILSNLKTRKLLPLMPYQGDNTCCVCFDGMRRSSRTTKTFECGHSVHVTCVPPAVYYWQNLMHTNNFSVRQISCPMCRHPVIYANETIPAAPTYEAMVHDMEDLLGLDNGQNDQNEQSESDSEIDNGLNDISDASVTDNTSDTGDIDDTGDTDDSIDSLLEDILPLLEHHFPLPQ